VTRLATRIGIDNYDDDNDKDIIRKRRSAKNEEGGRFWTLGEKICKPYERQIRRHH
jgi:hypothetical protein